MQSSKKSFLLNLITYLPLKVLNVLLLGLDGSGVANGIQSLPFYNTKANPAQARDNTLFGLGPVPEVVCVM